MCENYRILSPVGQGGFDIEFIDGTSVIFDCGSTPNWNVEYCISHYKNFLDRVGGHGLIKDSKTKNMSLIMYSFLILMLTMLMD